jgi:hypothetical protein
MDKIKERGEEKKRGGKGDFPILAPKTSSGAQEDT